MRGFEASWLITGVPGDSPQREAAIVLDERERVVALGSAGQLRAAYPGVAFVREQAILLPGLVNAHMHLELSALRGQTRSGAGFGPWVTGLMERRDALQPEQDQEAIDAAVSELLRAGTAAIGEVTNTLTPVEALASAPILVRVFHELFGMSRASASERLALARQARARASWPRHVGYALAPHTLYSLHPDGVRELLAEVRAGRGRTSLHLAEHAAERAFLRTGGGPFSDFLRGRKVPHDDFPVPGLAPIAYAEALGALAPDVIAVHLCAIERDELARVAAAGAPAVLCPRSNLFIELKLPPLFDILDAGLRPGLGSDSLASNTTLDVLAEAAALRDRFPQLDPGILISMATWYGAVALGLSHRVGALRVGLAPGLLAFDLERPIDDPLRYLLRSPPPARRVLARPALPEPGQTLEDPP